MKVVFEFLEISKNIKSVQGLSSARRKKTKQNCGYYSDPIISQWKYKNKINNVNALLFYFVYSGIWWLFLWYSSITIHLLLPSLFIFGRGMACGISVPPPGIELVPPVVEAQSLNHWTVREVPALTLRLPECYKDIRETKDRDNFCISPMITLSLFYRLYGQKQVTYWPGPLEAF